MKRILTILVSAMLMTAALCITASASSFDSTAEELSTIGMFRGTGNGFELDRAPTRSEAAIMLVRLYGAEETAQASYAAGKLTSPFTDVSETVAPYAAWLYTNGITKGTTETTFGGRGQCNLNMYTVFLLRALGYEDGVDFTYDTAPDFAMTRGILSSSILDDTFLRDDLAAITYQALGTDLKDGSTYLLNSLIQSGAVSAEAAKPITDKIETYRALAAVSAGTTSMDASLNAKVTMDMTINATDESGQTLTETETTEETVTGSVKMILDNDIQMAAEMAVTADGETVRTGTWLKDGWMYTQTGDMAYKMQIGDMGEIMEIYQEILSVSNQAASIMLPYIDTISSAKSGSNTVYTLSVDGSALNSMMNDVMGLLGAGDLGMGMDMQLTDCTYTYTVASNGQLKTCTAALGMTMGMDLSDETGTASIDIAMKMDMDMKVNATGKDVKISYPSFSKFVDMGSLITIPEQPALWGSR